MPFDKQPTLSGPRVLLRPLEPSDKAALYTVASDPLIWEQHPVADRYSKPVFDSFFDDSIESGGALIAIDRQAERVIGSTRFHGYDPQSSEIEIGWTFLSRAFWGGVFNGEIKRLMLRHAFQYVDTVIFLVGLKNVRSQRAVEKLGAVRDGTRMDGGGTESFVYRIDSDRPNTGSR